MDIELVTEKHADITKRFPDGTEITVPCTCGECGAAIVTNAQKPRVARSSSKKSISIPETRSNILSRSKEIEYSLILNAGRHLANLEGQATASHETPPPADSTLLLLSHLADEMTLLDILCRHWDLPVMAGESELDAGDNTPCMSFNALIGEKVRQKLLTNEISDELKAEIAELTDCRPQDVFEKIDRLALTCWLLPKGVDELDKHVRDLSKLNEFLDDDGDARYILNISSEKSDFQSHFSNIRSTYQETRDTFFYANTGLVAKHVREQLAVYNGRLDSFRSEAKREGLVGLAEARERFSYRMATNSTADRPFAGFARDWIYFRILHFLARCADAVIDPSQGPEEPNAEWFAAGLNLSPIAELLSEIETEILLMAGEQQSRNFAEIGRSFTPRITGQMVSRLRSNVLNRINYHTDEIIRQREFVDSLPDHIRDNLCSVQFIVLNARYLDGLGFAAIGDKLSMMLKNHSSLTGEPSHKEIACSQCSRVHAKLTRLGEKKPHNRGLIPQHIMGKIEQIFTDHDIQFPVVGQARGTKRRKI